MPNANWSNPTLTSTYTNFVSEVKNRDEDLALQFDGTTSTNIPTNTIRWDSGANRWKKWNGSTWVELTSTYALTGLSTTGNATVGGTLGVTGAATLSGGGTSTTPAVDNNTGAIATTAFVAGQASTASPLVNGTATAGTSLRYSRQDHVHPTDTTRAPLASPTFSGTVTIPAGASISGYAQLDSPAFTGTPVAPTAAVGTNTTQIATTAFVASSAGRLADGSAAAPSLTFTSDIDTGLFSVTANTLGVTTGGAERLRFNPNGSVKYLGSAGFNNSNYGVNISDYVDNGSHAEVTIAGNSSAGYGGGLVLRMSRGTPSAPATAAIDDDLGYIYWDAYNASLGVYRAAAQISARIDGNFGANGWPGRIGFYTNDGSSTAAPFERLRIASNGQISATVIGSGIYPGYFCRAWVSWVGSSAGIRASGNVSSVARNGVGDWTVNFSTAMPDANYSVTGFAKKPLEGSDSIMSANASYVYSTTQVRVGVCSSGNTREDSPIANLAVFR